MLFQLTQLFARTAAGGEDVMRTPTSSTATPNSVTATAVRILAFRYCLRLAIGGPIPLMDGSRRGHAPVELAGGGAPRVAAPDLCAIDADSTVPDIVPGARSSGRETGRLRTTERARNGRGTAVERP